MSTKHYIPYGEHPSQFGELRLPNNDKLHPVIVTIHGGFWQSKYDLYENDPICDDLTARGFATWNIEYRRVGENGGGWKGTFNDVIAAVNHLRILKKSYPLDLSNVVIIGHSAGGQLGLWLASRANDDLRGDKFFTELVIPIHKVISLAGVTDLEKMWEIHHEQGLKSVVADFIGGSPTKVAERYEVTSPIKLSTDIEQVLIHGELDRHVPAQLSKDYYEKMKKSSENINLILLEDVEHFKIIDPNSTAWESVVKHI